MADSFDPYYKWLGIPPKDQPPHHYRLLGIELFEDDRDVIDAAANRVMSYLKDMSTGDDAAHSQTLLNEISRARICLLNKDKKVAYDEQLRQKLKADGLLDEGPKKPPAKKPPPKPAKPSGPPPAEPPTSLLAPPTGVRPPPLAPSEPFPALETGPPKAVIGEAVSIVVDGEAEANRIDTERKAGEPAAADLVVQAKPRGSRRLLGTIVALLLVSVVGVVGALILFGGGDDSEAGQESQRKPTVEARKPPVLVMRLSSQEREELTAFLLDGVPQQLPPVSQYVLNAGEHKLVLRRDGFQEIRQTIRLVDGVRRDFRPRWRFVTDSTPPSTILPSLGPDFQSTAVDGFTSGYGRMVGHWKFDDDARDDSGSDAQATLIGSPVFVAGQTGRALRLADHQRIEVAGSLFADSSEFSLTFWLKLQRVPDTSRPMLEADDLEIHLQGGFPKLRVRRLDPVADEKTDEQTKGFKGIEIEKHLNQWIHLGLVYSAPACQVHYYLNGEHQGFQRYAEFAPAEISRLGIGNLTADIDDLRVFDYRLNSIAVKAILDGDFQPLLAAPEGPNGKVVCETWHDVSENLTRRQIERITVDSADATNTLNKGLWDLLPLASGNCLNRIRGFLYPPEDGEYMFLLRSSGAAMFYLQRFEPNEDSLAQIVDNGTARRQSVPVPLEGGRAYYFEVLHQYDDTKGGLCHISLGCKPANGAKRRLFAPPDPRNRQNAIPAEYLASYGDED